MRSLGGLVCVFGTTLMLLAGCSGDGGVGGYGGDGGSSGSGGTPPCRGPDDCPDFNACTEDFCVDGVCEHTALQDGAACGQGPGMCDAGSCVGGVFVCTEQGIRDAINAGGGPHMFDCDAPVITTSTISVHNDVILDGEGGLTVSGGGTHRVFSVFGTAELRGLTVTAAGFGGGGTGGAGRDGGGIYVYSSSVLTLADATVSDNDGGGIINAGGVLRVAGCVITRNTEGPSGGGIANSGSLTVTDSTISDNTSIVNGGIGACTEPGATADIIRTVVARNVANSGGGIGAGSGCALTVTDSTVSDNEAVIGNGGGIRGGEDGTVTVIRSTISSNSAGRNGGGVYVSGGGDLAVVSSTISGNTADDSGGGMAVDTNGVAFVTSTTLADNASPAGGAIETLGSLVLAGSVVVGDCAYLGPAPSVTNTVEGIPSGRAFESTCNGNIMDWDSAVALGPLQDNGGPAETQALGEGSIAIDVIPEEECVDMESEPLTTDQRGEPRPETAGAMCDAGAFEVQ